MSTTPDRHFHLTLRMKAILIAAAIIAVIWLQFIQWPMPLTNGIDHRDSGVFAHGGWVIAKGGTPYVDFWDQKPPVVFLLNAIAIRIFSMQMIGAWWLSLVSLLVSLYLAWVVLSRWVGRDLAAVLSVLYAVSFAGVLQGGNSVELYAVVCQWLLWWLAIQWLDSFAEKRKGRGYRFLLATLGGGLAGVLHALRQNEAAVAFAVLIALVWNEIAERRGKSVLVLIGGGLLGQLVVWIPLLVWLARNGALNAFIDQVYTYNLTHKIATTAAMRLDAFGAIFDYLPVFAAGFIGWILLMWRGLKGETAFGLRERILALTLPFGLLAVLASGQRFPHYYITLLPVSVAFAGLFLSAPGPLWKRLTVRGWSAVQIAMILLALITIVKTPNNVWRPVYSMRGKVVTDSADEIRKLAGTNGSLFVWGMVPEIYAETGVKPSGPYTHVYPLLSPGYTDSALVDDFIRKFGDNPPKLILDASSENGRIPPLDHWSAGFTFEGKPLEPELQKFYEYVAKNYAPVDTVAPWSWVIYSLKPDSPLRVTW